MLICLNDLFACSGLTQTCKLLTNFSKNSFYLLPEPLRLGEFLTNYYTNMKKFLLSLATAFSFVLFLGSCTNEEDINNNGYSDKEKAKIETLMNLFDSYGWELDTTVSIEQRNKELLEMDYEKTKSFLEYMSNGIEFDNFEPTQQSEDNAPKALSNTRSTMTFPI